MDYRVTLDNDTPRLLGAVVLAALGIWAVWRIKRQRPRPWSFLIGSLVLGIALCIPMVLWRWTDGQCGWLTGFPLVIERVQTSCIDVVSSTGISVPLAIVDAALAIGLGSSVALGALRVSGKRAW
jgi:hypothetical protein